jgi:subtilisin family serine protease
MAQERRRMFVLASLWISTLIVLGAGRAPAPLEIAPGSPLLADDSSVFAIAADRQTILVRPADLVKPWEPLPTARRFGHIEGLAREDAALYVLDGEGPSVFRLDRASGAIDLVHQGAPLQHPNDIVVSKDVFVADGSRLWRLSKSDEPRLVPLRASRSAQGQMFLAATENSLLVSYPAEARIDEYRVSGRSGGATKWAAVQRKADPSDLGDVVDTVQKSAFPEIKHPTRLAYHRGIVYVVDASESPALYAFGRHDQRAVRLVRNGTDEGAASSVAVTRQSIYVQHGAELQRWPRLVPAQVVLPPSNLSAIMTRIYRYLLENRILPARAVTVEQNIERTLRANRVLLGAYVADITPILCQLNRGLCLKGDLRSVHEGEPFSIPDVNSESFVDVSEPMPVDRGKTLGDTVDRRVVSQEFTSYRSEEKLRELNEKEAYQSKTPLRERTDGVFVVPTEYVRYVVPIVASDAPPAAGPLLRITKEYEGVKIQSQEERLAMAYGSGGAGQPPPPPQWEELKSEWSQLLQTIEYADPAQPLGTAKVGIAEEFVDEQHPDFVDQGASAWIAEDASLSAEPAGVVPSMQAYRIRDFDRTDHGTMIGGVIGARHMEFQASGGLAPRALLFHIHSSDPQIGEDIRRSFLRGVHIFNISAHFGKDRIPSSLEERVRLHPTALFVVAAGNDVVPGRDLEICNGLLAYPVCWADRKNVLVVTATNAAGDTVLAPITTQDPVIAGANWSPSAVHVAAPGVGFHAPGMNKSYVPARGSSFATPLVTALAALLYGERVFEPWAIKQRIIATADPVSGLNGKVFAGRINVRQAIQDISDSIFIRKPRNGNPGQTLHADVDTASRITVRFDDGSDKVIRLADVRRVQRQGNRYRVIYVDRDSIRIDMVTFPTDLSSRISANAKDTGASIKINLIEWDDFIAPVPIM